MFTRAIVRAPAVNFSAGLTAANLGPPDYERALAQHSAYCAALEQCGLTLTRLPADSSHPDSTFVEDAAVLTPRGAILARPGAPSRAGEVASIKHALAGFYPAIQSIEGPGTLDGGDVCKAEDHFFIGISARTNEIGARQLSKILATLDYTSSFVDIRGLSAILHLKSGIAYLGDNRLALISVLARRKEFSGPQIVPVEDDAVYAANCVRLNDRVLVASGHAGWERQLRALGYQLLVIEMSEFQKMDGGLSCLSLRF